MNKRELFGSIIVLVGLSLLFSYWLDYVNVEAGNPEPVYVILKEPILVSVESCKDGVCNPDVAMIYKMRVHNLEISDSGMVRFGLYHREARLVLGSWLKVPMYNIRCIVTGENKIKGHMWE